MLYPPDAAPCETVSGASPVLGVAAMLVVAPAAAGASRWLGPIAGLAAIDLTSVSQEAAELARSAVGTAITLLEEPTKDRAETVLEPRLVSRSTTSHPRASASGGSTGVV